MTLSPSNLNPSISTGSWKSLRRFLAYVLPYRPLLIGGVATGILRYLVPLALPWTVKVLVDDFLGPVRLRPETHLHLLMASLIGLYALYAVASFWRSYLAGRAGHRVIFDLRQALYLHVQRMSLSFFDRQRIGAVVSRMTTDI